MFFSSFNEEVRTIFNEDKEKFLVISWIIFNTNYQDEYNGLKKNQCYFSYSVMESEFSIKRWKLQKIMRELEESKKICWILKSTSKGRESILMLNEPYGSPYSKPYGLSYGSSIENTGIKGDKHTVKHTDKHTVNHTSSINLSKNLSNNIYSSSADEIRDRVKKNFNIDRVLELYNVMKKSIPNVEEYEIWKEIENILTDENDTSSNNKKLDKETNVIKKKSVKSREFKWKFKEYEEAFKEIWAIYPNKRGIANAKKSINKLLDHYSKDELMRAVKRYDSECKGKEIKYIKIGSTFFNSGYEDYLDENYISLDTSSTKKEYKPKSDNFD